MASSATAFDILHFVTKYSLYSGYVIFIGGIIGNAINILVYIHLKLFRDNRCALYMIVESIVNIGNLIIFFANSMLTAAYDDDPAGSSLVWCRMRSMLFQTFALISASMVCLAACDQFFSTNHQFNLRQLCTLKLARCLTLVASCIWFLHSIVFGLFLDIQPSLGCVISNPIWTRYSSYFFYPVLYGLLPIIVASSFSLLAFRNVRRIVRRQVPVVRRRLDRQMTAMVLARVAFFVAFSLPYSIYRIYAINVSLTRENLLQYAIGRLLQTVFVSFTSLNYAISFYIFVVSSSRYRRQVKTMLVKKYWRQWKHWCCVSQNRVVPGNSISTVSIMEHE